MIVKQHTSDWDEKKLSLTTKKSEVARSEHRQSLTKEVFIFFFSATTTANKIIIAKREQEKKKKLLK